MSLYSQRDEILRQMKLELSREFDLWYPLCIDTVFGGYFSDINYKWELDGPQNKMIVTQARQVWSNARGSLYYGKREPFYDRGKQGYEFLRNVMWDTQHGGFYDVVTREGVPILDHGEIIKTAYGNAFAIYALAAYCKSFDDTSALDLAKETFYWLKDHSYDPEFGGYFQFITREGKPYEDGYRGVPPKDQNSMIHLLEGYTELYELWHDQSLQTALSDLMNELLDKAIGEKHHLTLFFKRDWTPVSYRDSSKEVIKKNIEFDHISFGHDIETAYLILEAAKVLGKGNDPRIQSIAKSMVDLAIRNGFDQKIGGVYDGGYQYKNDSAVTIVIATKEWWAQIEALNSLLMMSEEYPDDPTNYYQRFVDQWNYIKEYVLDNEHGGWYWGGIDAAPENRLGPKATIWKANYHTVRGLVNCILRLQGKM